MDNYFKNILKPIKPEKVLYSYTYIKNYEKLLTYC